MNRRTIIRRSMLFSIAMALGKLDVLKADEPGTGLLTVDLDQWRAVSFKHRGKEIAIPVSEVFKALSEMDSVKGVVK